MNLIHFIYSNNKQGRVIGFVCCLLLLAACSKKDSDPAPANCKLASLSYTETGGASETVTFTHSNDGKLKYLNVSGTPAEFFYHINGYTRRTNSGNGWRTHSFVELNATGQPKLKKDTTFNGQSINNTHITTYEYNNQGELVKVFIDGNPQPSSSFVWQNGNVVKVTEGNASVILDYYTDKPNQDFTFIDLKLFISAGTHLAKSKNLLRSITSGGQQLIFNYEFDQQGKLKTAYGNLLGNPDTALTGTYSYICD